MIKFTIYSSVLLAACASAATVDTEARYAHGTCSFDATHKQLCSPSSPEGPINYISIATILDNNGEVITDARSQRPPAEFNSFSNLNKGPWNIIVSASPKGRFQRANERQNQKILSVTGSVTTDTITYKYVDENWTTEDGKEEGRESWCEVQPWDQEGWQCVNGQTIDPEVQCEEGPCSVDPAHDSMRERQMKCYFAC